MKLLLQLYSSWFKVGLFTFGGGYAMLPLIQREMIDHHHWASEDEIMDYFAIAQCTPGVIAVNTATFVGYSLKGVTGGIVATLGVVTPSIIIICIIAGTITNFTDVKVIQHALHGVQIAVCMLMFNSIRKLWKASIKNIAGVCIFAIALLLAVFTDISTVVLVVVAGVSGVVLCKLGWLYE